MGNKNSKAKTEKGTKNRNKSNQGPPAAKQMPYKREFSSKLARQQQENATIEYQESLEIDDQKTNSNYANVLDPKKFKPPPSPLNPNDESAPQANSNSNSNNTTLAAKAINENEEMHDTDSMDDVGMTTEEQLQMKQTTQRGMRPGLNVLTVENEQDLNQNQSKNTPSPHNRVESQRLQSHNLTNIANNNNNNNNSHDNTVNNVNKNHNHNHNNNWRKVILWGYCELTRKQLDEDQAAFLTWTHKTDGFVHAWAIFDGHGGYQAALYSAQHFLTYLQKYHNTRANISNEEWKPLMSEIFMKFDEHIGKLKIGGGSTVVVVLLIKRRLIIANAGDARAIYSHQNGKALPLSFDHSPMDDYDRLLAVAKKRENFKLINRYFRLNGKHETQQEFRDLTVSEKQKAPFISRELGKSRLLATIGVARGFGDYNLTVFGFKNIALKPFLTAEPFVDVIELSETDILETDLMCVACDGIFDVMSNQQVIDALRREVYYRKPEVEVEVDAPSADEDSDEDGANAPASADLLEEPNSAITAKIVDRACSFLGLKAYSKGTMDDVSVFVIPLRQIFDVPR